MPTLCWSSPLLKSTADGLSLAAEITHELKLAVDDEPILKIQKFPSPESLDILSSSNVLLRLTGTFEMKRVSTETLRRSSLAAYLLEYLKFHSAQLFIGSISDPYVNADGTLEFAITSSRALLDPDELPVTTATLSAINWSFVWKSDPKKGACVNPFSPQHLLPVQNIVGFVVEKVLSRDFVRSYPLIFGSWRNSLGAEMDMFPQVVQPILNIISRSRDPAFQKQCRRLLGSLRKGNDTVYDNSLDGLGDVLGSLTLGGVSALRHRDDEKILLVSLQRLHRTLFRAEHFKASMLITNSDRPLHNSDHVALLSDTLPEYSGAGPFEGPDYSPLDPGETDFMDLFTESESSPYTGNAGILPSGSEETADTYLFEEDAGGFTLAGLDDDWESVDLQLSPTERRERRLLDGNSLSLGLAAAPAELAPHASACSDVSRFCDLDAALDDQPMLDLGSYEDDEMDREIILDF